MKSNYDLLGNHIRLIDNRNKDLVTEQVLGINIDKFFMPSVANVIGTDLSKYKLIQKGNFACNPMHVGRDERLPVALYSEDTPAIVSPAYFMFEIKDATVLNADFLMMWFRRPEFDRICWLHTDGSVRGGITWDDICRMEIPVPPIDEQIEIVNSYQAITERVKLKKQINDNLDAQIQSIYKELFIDFNPFRDTISEDTKLPEGWSYRQIEECGFDISDGNYSSKYPKYDEFVSSGIPFIRGTDFVGKYISTKNVLYITPEMHADLKKGHTKQGDLLMSTRGEIGKIAFVPDNLVDANINSQLVRINGNSILPRVYLAYTLLSETVKNEIKSLITGSVQEQLPIGKLQKIHILFPSKEIVEHFCKLAEPLLAAILQNEHEIVVLNNTSERILETLSRR